MTIYVGTIVLVSWEGDEGGGGKLVEYEMGFRNWRRSGGLNKGGGDESGAEAGEGYKEKVACMLG